MSFTKQQLIFLGVAGVIIVVFLAIFLAGGRKPTEKIELTIWGTDNELAWDYAILHYQKLHPNVRIKYIEFTPGTYEKDLINGLAAGRGPDIFMINNRWVAKHSDKIVPLPDGKLGAGDFKNLFPQVAEYDFFGGDGKIYGLPLSVDTLALFYNRDIFDRRGVALPPKTWDEFTAVIPKLRGVDRGGNLTSAAAAIGGSVDSIPNAPDILELLMLQTGALAPDKYPSQTIRSREGENALEFYSRFTNPKDSSYTWNDSFAPAVEAFAEGKVAMTFGYANDIPEIKSKNPFLNFAVEPAPQTSPEKAVNIANYWALTASSKTQNSETAWDFIVSAATDKEVASHYLTSTGQPPALRTLISEHLNDPDLGVFARQALTARSFYQGDDITVRAIFDKVIKKAISGNSISEVLQEAETELYKLENTKQ